MKKTLTAAALALIAVFSGFSGFAAAEFNAAGASVTEENQVDNSAEAYFSMLREHYKKRGKTYSNKYLTGLNEQIVMNMGNGWYTREAKSDKKLILKSLFGTSLHLEKGFNCVVVYIFHLNDRKAAAFRKYISDSDAILLLNTDGYSVEDAVSPNGKNYSYVTASGAKREITLKVGETKVLSKASRSGIKLWDSEDSEIATVKNGKITAVKKGKTIVTATLSAAVKRKYIITVK